MYIPKNKIKTDQYTRGGEYQSLITGNEYVGSYWLMYNGKIFSGVDPNDTPQEELVPFRKSTIEPIIEEGNDVQEYAYNWNKETVPGQYQNMELVSTYNAIRAIDMSKVTFLPQEFYPTPTDEDYKLGKFTRYFCVKVNEPIFTEISQVEYDKFNNQDPNYDWITYSIFVLDWVITGNEEDVEQTNFNQIQLVEERLGKKGLAQYLMGNYIQYFARNSAEVLYSNGEDGLVLPDGTAYIGYYHAMLDGTIMTGKYHSKGKDIVLTQIYD
jgi:hypothetical protein